MRTLQNENQATIPSLDNQKKEIEIHEEEMTESSAPNPNEDSVQHLMNHINCTSSVGGDSYNIKRNQPETIDIIKQKEEASLEEFNDADMVRTQEPIREVLTPQNGGAFENQHPISQI